jgi:hypothetical protein
VPFPFGTQKKRRTAKKDEEEENGKEKNEEWEGAIVFVVVRIDDSEEGQDG